MEQKMKRIAPDGGWGWMVVIGFALSNLICIPVMQNFGLLFRYVFLELDMKATDISTVMNLNSSIGMLFGLMNGPLIKKYGYRKYAISGSILMFIGFSLTSRATTLAEFIIYYGIIFSIGMSQVMSAFGLAINTFFVTKRSMATGFCTTLTGLGPIVMPLFVSKSVTEFGARGTALILAACLLHSFAAALLLQPIKWHEKLIPDTTLENEIALLNSEIEGKSTDELDNALEPYESASIQDCLENANYPRRFSIGGPLSGRRGLSQSKHSLFDKELTIEPDPRWWSKESNDAERDGENSKIIKLLHAQSISNVSKLAVVSDTKVVKWYHKIIKLFDLDLLKDPVYRNIWIGISLAFTGEIIFSLMTPLIFGDRGFGMDDTARFMAVIASSDIIFRFLSPFIGDWAKMPTRHMYMSALVMLVTARLGLTLVSSYWPTIIVCVGLGVAKGFRTVYMTLVIPNHVPLEKLPSAVGLQTVLNGIFLFISGPIAGFAKEIGGNYNMSIHFVNILSSCTVLLWGTEMIIMRVRAKKDNLKEPV